MNITHSDLDLPGDHYPMPAPVEEVAVAPPRAVGTASRKMLQLLRKRLRQLSWCMLGLALVAGVFAIWWLTSLSGLPDIGDPFDVAAFKSSLSPDDRNGVVFFRRAIEKLAPLPEVPQAAKSAAARGSWSKLDPKLQRWVEANRPAIELLQQGADHPDVNWGTDDEFFWQRLPIVNPGGLLWLALVEGGRRAGVGDMAGAWDCYRAVLRTTTHLRRRGNVTLRFIVNDFHTDLRRRLADWAADPKTTIPQLRRALDEATLSRPRLEWDVVSLKLEYLHLMRLLERPRYSLHRAINEGVTYRIGNYQVPDEWAMYLFLGDRFLKREPERSRRAIRLLFANWLAHLEGDNPRQTGPSVRVSFSLKDRPNTVPLYPVGPQATAGARARSPRDLANWLVTTKDARSSLWVGIWPACSDQERRGYRRLVILLAEELYRREHGVLPPSEDALLGKYLQTLPEDDSAEPGDGTAPVVSD